MIKAPILVGVLVLFGLAYLSLGPLPAHGQIQAVRALNLYDANGQKVGKLFAVESGPTPTNPILTFKANGIPFTLLVDNLSPYFVGTAHDVFFANPGCSGQAYLLPNGMMAATATFAPNATVYISDPGAIPSQVPVNSARQTSGGACSPNNTSALLVPAISVGDFLPRFTPPFTVR